MSKITVIKPKDVIVSNENGQPRLFTRKETVAAILEGRVQSLSRRQIQPILAHNKLWKQLPEETRNALISDWVLLNTLLMQTTRGERFPEILSDFRDNVSVRVPQQFRNNPDTRLEIDLNQNNFTTESYKGGILLHFKNPDEVIQSDRLTYLSNVDFVRLLACDGSNDVFSNRWNVNAYGGSGNRFRVLENSATPKLNGEASVKTLAELAANAKIAFVKIEGLGTVPMEFMAPLSEYIQAGLKP